MQLYPVGGGGNKILSNTMQHQTKTASVARNTFDCIEWIVCIELSF